MNFFSFISSKKNINLFNRAHLLNGMYIVLMAVITLGIAFTFINATRFLLRMFDETLRVSETDMKVAVVLFDREKLAFFAPKLGINPPSGAANKETPIVLPSPSPSPQVSTISQEALHVDKKALHLRILNGTAISGLAKQWGDWFIEQGFTRVTTAMRWKEGMQALL